MATHKSAEKRDRQNKKRNLRNRSASSTMSTAIKAVRDAAATGNKEDLSKKLKSAQKIVAQTVRKGALHKNTGSRYVARLATLANKATTKASTTKTASK
jgi:small subunit ribosomal protein S20